VPGDVTEFGPRARNAKISSVLLANEVPHGFFDVRMEILKAWIDLDAVGAATLELQQCRYEPSRPRSRHDVLVGENDHGGEIVADETVERKFGLLDARGCETVHVKGRGGLGKKAAHVVSRFSARVVV
jgi:hypothetical protein